MRIRDLPHPITAIKSHWNPEFPDRLIQHNGWVGFTPSHDTPASRGRLRSTIARQMGKGYVIEYVTITLPSPNAGTTPLAAEEKSLHERAAGSVTAVLKL